MNILVINAGSSSLKYQLIDIETENVLAKGLCERIGIDGNGRILIPKRYLESADIQGEVRFIGMDDSIEIWNRQKADNLLNNPEKSFYKEFNYKKHKLSIRITAPEILKDQPMQIRNINLSAYKPTELSKLLSL